jgi:hypothetical protein
MNIFGAIAEGLREMGYEVTEHGFLYLHVSVPPHDEKGYGAKIWVKCENNYLIVGGYHAERLDIANPRLFEKLDSSLKRARRVARSFPKSTIPRLQDKAHEH